MNAKEIRKLMDNVIGERSSWRRLSLRTERRGCLPLHGLRINNKESYA